jgi:hypothetical protein
VAQKKVGIRRTFVTTAVLVLASASLAVLPAGTIACLYERGEKHAYETITLAWFSLGWLTAADLTQVPAPGKPDEEPGRPAR